MTNPIKPIETRYAGHRFRSRLEARWCVLFEQLGFEWHYEEEGYELPSGRYLPDFRIVHRSLAGPRDIWVEVKGRFGHDDLTKVIRAAMELPRIEQVGVSPQILILGEVPQPEFAPSHARIDVIDGAFGITPVMFVPRGRGAALKPLNETAWMSADWTERWTADMTAEVREGLTSVTYEPSNRFDDRAAAAYLTARSARFEFGEQG